jgi:hypothetical protein
VIAVGRSQNTGTGDDFIVVKLTGSNGRDFWPIGLILLKQYSSDKNIKSVGLVFFYCSNMDPAARSDHRMFSGQSRFFTNQNATNVFHLP